MPVSAVMHLRYMRSVYRVVFGYGLCCFGNDLDGVSLLDLYVEDAVDELGVLVDISDEFDVRILVQRFDERSDEGLAGIFESDLDRGLRLLDKISLHGNWHSHALFIIYREDVGRVC